MARVFVLLALLAVFTPTVFCQSQNPGCSSIDLISIPLNSSYSFIYDAFPGMTLYTPNARFAFVTQPGYLYEVSPWFTAASWVDYDVVGLDAQMLDTVRAHFAANSTATRKVVLITTYENTPNDDFQAVIAAGRRLKQSGVEIHVLAERDQYSDFWTELASPKSIYFESSNPSSGSYRAEVYNPLIKGLTGLNSSGCAILGANPRVSTFDGSEYTFNGLGDYWLVRSTSNSNNKVSSQYGSFSVQLRFGPCDNSAPSSGSCVRAAAFKDEYSSGGVVTFQVDPATGLLSIIDMYGNILQRDSSMSFYIGSYYIYTETISTPYSSAIGYKVTIYQYYGDRAIGFVLGEKMGVNAFVVLNFVELGTTTGLCGTFDGCGANDYYSADQQYVNTGDSAANIHNGFAETWRVSAEESFFANTDFDMNTYYVENYPYFSKDWNPRTDAIAVTSETAEACKFFADKSKYLYNTCTDSIAMGIPQYAAVSSVFLLDTCRYYCERPYFLQFSFVEEEFCQATCDPYFNWDFHDTYNATNIPYAHVVGQSYGATSQFTLGGTYTIAYFSHFCPTEVVNATVSIACDQSPVVNAGADRTVSRGPYGFPTVYLSGSASDVNEPNLQYSWRVIDAPLARNTSERDGYWNPQGYPSPSSVEIYYSNTPNAVMYIEYPGIYVIELAVFDGCSIAKDTVTVNVTCDDCEFTVTAWGEGIHSATADVDSYPSVDLLSYIYTSNSYPGYEWSLESTTTGLKVVLYDDDYDKEYHLVQEHVDQIINSTTETIETGYNNVTDYEDTTLVTDYNYINRYEGEMFVHVSYEQYDYDVVTSEVLSDYEREERICTLEIDDADDQEATAALSTYKDSDNDYPAPFCNGDYTFRVDYSDECQDQSKYVVVKHTCVKSPVAHLVTCNPNLKFDYDDLSWPHNVQLDARDSYSEYYPTGSLHFIYDVTAAPAWYPAGRYTDGHGTTTTTFSIPSPTSTYPMRTMTAQWTFQTNVADDCSFGTSAPATINAACQDQNTVLYADATTLRSSNLTAGWNTVMLDSSASTGVNGIQFNYIHQLSGPATVLSTPASESALVTLTRGGVYTFLAETSDYCWIKNSSIVTVTLTCDAPITINMVANPTSRTATYTVGTGWNTVVLDASTSVHTTDVSRVSYTWSYTTPSGVTGDFAETTAILNFNPATFNTPGDYIVTFTIDDSCTSVSRNFTVTLACAPISAPTINVNTIAPTNGTTSTDVVLSTTPSVNVDWLVNNVAGAIVHTDDGTTTTYSTGTSGTYQATAFYGDNICNVAVTRNFTVACSHTPAFALTSATVTYTHNKFPKFTLTPAITGANPADPATRLPYRFDILSAPVGSVWAPGFEQMTERTNNTTPVITLSPGPNNTWIRNTTTSYTVYNYTFVKNVWLVNGDEPLQGCFAADIAGTYRVKLTVTGYCGQQIVSTVDMIAQCNARPTASAIATPDETIVNSYLSQFVYVLDGAASADTDGDNITHFWEITSVPENTYLANETDMIIYDQHAIRTEFRVNYPGTYGVRLTVSDGCQNATSDLNIVVSCNNNLALANGQQQLQFDGYTPVSLAQFTMVATKSCDKDQNWEIVDYVPAPIVQPPTPGGGGESSASRVALSFFALLALVALLL